MKALCLMAFLMSTFAVAATVRPGFQDENSFLVIDGEPQSLMSLAGGNIRAEVVEMNTGALTSNKKNIANISNEDFQLSMSAPFSKKMNAIINGILNGSPSRLNGFTAVTDFNNRSISEKEFRDALISEIVFPALDASSKMAYSVDIKMAAEAIVLRPSATAGVLNAATIRPALASNFRFELDGINRLNVSKVDPIVVKQKIVSNSIGGRRVNSNEPGKLSLSNITLYLPETQAKELFTWFEDFVIKGNNSDSDEKTGRIVMMDQTFSKDLMVLELSNVGIFSYSVVGNEGNSGKIRMVKAELYFEKLSIK